MIMKQTRSFKRFHQNEQYTNPTDEQLMQWHTEFKQMQRFTEEQKRFRRCFYRLYAKRLHLNIHLMIEDRRYHPPRLEQPRLFWTVLRTMEAAEILSGPHKGLVESIIQLYNLPYDAESMRSKYCSTIEVDEEILALLLKRIAESNK